MATTFLFNYKNCLFVEGDRKAYYENSQWTIKQNKDAVSQLRKDNKILRKKLSDCLAVSIICSRKSVHL